MQAMVAKYHKCPGFFAQFAVVPLMKEIIPFEIHFLIPVWRSAPEIAALDPNLKRTRDCRKLFIYLA